MLIFDVVAGESKCLGIINRGQKPATLGDVGDNIIRQERNYFTDILLHQLRSHQLSRKCEEYYSHVLFHRVIVSKPQTKFSRGPFLEAKGM